jgi:glycerol-3-phosphate acyltransferase PlsY
MNVLLLAIVSYLIGSISFAYIAGRLFRGIDIRTVGDQNAGARNVFRNVGNFAGIFVAILDMTKGAVVILLAQYFSGQIFTVFLCGFAAVIGHILPVFLGFRGGRGEATILGIFFAFLPLPMFIFTLIFLVILAKYRSVSIASAFLIIAVLATTLSIDKSFVLFLYFFSLSCFLGIIHLVTTRHLTAEQKEESTHI